MGTGKIDMLATGRQQRVGTGAGVVGLGGKTLRLPGNYHGSGCTLATAVAAHLAHGLDAVTAVQKAQDYTLQCLKQAIQLGRGQAIPDRLFWSRDSKSSHHGHHH